MKKDWPLNRRADDWSRDGRYIIEEASDPKTNRDIWVLPVTDAKAGKPSPYLQNPFNEAYGKLSLAYCFSWENVKHMFLFNTLVDVWLLAVAGLGYSFAFARLPEAVRRRFSLGGEQMTSAANRGFPTPAWTRRGF
jgi:hypothetical protein